MSTGMEERGNDREGEERERERGGRGVWRKKRVEIVRERQRERGERAKKRQDSYLIKSDFDNKFYTANCS